MYIRLQKGQIIPFLTFVVIILFIITLFTVNLGRIGFHRVRTSIGADSAALAGASYLNYSLNKLAASSRRIYIEYMVGMALAAIPLGIKCYLGVKCGKCAEMPGCVSEIALKVAMKLASMLAFITYQYLRIENAENNTYQLFLIARANAREIAFSNAGIDDLTKLDPAAGISFTPANPDAILSSTYDPYFILRDQWLNKARQDARYTDETWQKADSRFSLWLDLWREKNDDDIKKTEKGKDNPFNNFGAMEFSWLYPQRGRNLVRVDIQGDGFSGVQAVPSPVFGSVMGTMWICIVVPTPKPKCVSVPFPIFIPLVLVGPKMFIIGINDFASGGKEPHLTVSISRQEPQGQDLVIWQTRYPEVTSSATAEAYGGSVGIWGKDDYDSRIISTR